MGSISDYLEDKLLDHVFKTTAFSQPAGIFVALSTADPTDDGSGIAEPSGGGYARVQSDNWDVAASRATENTDTITFPAATDNWGTITHFAIFDAITSGNMLAHGALSASQAVTPGNIVSFSAGGIDVSVTAGAMSDYLANELLDHVFLTGAFSVPSNIYVGFTSAAVTDSDTGSTITEISGNNYARTVMNAWDASSGGATENTNVITFPTASGTWLEITDMVATDASSAGNLLFYATVPVVSPSVIIVDTQVPTVPAGSFDVTLD
jgi:hypothetical protein